MTISRLAIVTILLSTFVACGEADRAGFDPSRADSATSDAPRTNDSTAAGDGRHPDSIRATSPERPTDSSAALALDGEGLRILRAPSGSSRALPFGTSAADILAIIERAQGAPPREDGYIEDCALRFATWEGGLTTYFSDGRFVGWGLRDSEKFRTVSGIGIGSTLEEVENVYDVELRRSTLGVELAVGGMAGLLDSESPDAILQQLWAGATCIAR